MSLARATCLRLARIASVTIALAACLPQLVLGQTGRAAAIRHDVQEILASPQYAAHLRRGRLVQTIGEWLINVLNAIAEALERLFRFSGVGDKGTARILSWLVIFGLLCVVGYAAIRAASLWARSRRSVRRTPGSRVKVAKATPPAPTSAEVLLAAARDALSRGEWLRAYRLAFECLLVRLHETGAILLDAAKTNGEHIASLRTHPDLWRLVVPLARRFDAVVYGTAVPTREHVLQCLQACESPLVNRPSGSAGSQ